MTQMTSGQLYLRLLGYVRPYWRVFAAFVVALIVTAATEPALPALMKPMLDGTFVERDPFWIRMIPLVIIGLFVVRGIATYIGTYAGNWVGNKVVTDMREAMFRKLVQLPGRYYADNLSGNLISKVSYDASQVTAAATTVLTSVVKDCIVILSLLGETLVNAIVQQIQSTQSVESALQSCCSRVGTCSQLPAHPGQDSPGRGWEWVELVVFFLGE